MSGTMEDEAAPVGQPPQKDFPIDPPIKFNGAEYTTLSLREPTLDQLRSAQEQLNNGANYAATSKYQQYLIHNVSKVPVAVVGQLKISLVTEAMNYLGFFIQGGRATGEI